MRRSTRIRLKAWCIFACGTLCVGIPYKYGVSTWWTVPVYMLAAWIVESLADRHSCGAEAGE